MAGTTFYVAFISTSCIGRKFCLAVTLDIFNVFTVNYAMKDQQQCFQDCQIRTIRPPNAVTEVDITEKQQKRLTAAFHFCLSLACNVMLLSAFQASFTFWFLYDNYQGSAIGQSCKFITGA